MLTIYIWLKLIEETFCLEEIDVTDISLNRIHWENDFCLINNVEVNGCKSHHTIIIAWLVPIGINLIELINGRL